MTAKELIYILEAAPPEWEITIWNHESEQETVLFTTFPTRSGHVVLVPRTNPAVDLNRWRNL